MAKNRIPELLKKAADAFEQGVGPFSSHWLAENEVTSSECFELSDQIATIIRGHFMRSPEEQMETLALGVMYKEPKVVIDALRSSLKLSRTAKELGQMANKIKDAK